MARSETHTRKRSKNLFAFIVLMLFVMGLYYLTMIKMGGA